MNSNYLMICYLFFVTLFLITIYYLILPYLLKLKFGQSIRQEGPRSHFKKSGTPTMGGIIIFISFFVIFVSLIFLTKNHANIDIFKMLLAFIPLLGYFGIGFIDDFLIIWKKKNQGLKAITKFCFELLIALVFYIILIVFNYDTNLYIFNYKIDLLFFYGLFIILLFTSTTNATNLTDGVDGLLTISTIPLLLGFIILGFIKGNNLVILLSISLLLSLIAFLFFNFPKAKIFMGDTGSLFIGAFICLMVILLKIELYLIIMGSVFVLETMSVILQVSYFKITKGKRLFKMTPFHHHLELSGLSDIKINLIFFSVSLLSVIISLILLGVF